MDSLPATNLDSEIFPLKTFLIDLSNLKLRKHGKYVVDLTLFFVLDVEIYL